MVTCPQCDGDGFVTYEEDPGRYVTDACYHCGTTGEIDDDQDFQNRLKSAANQIAFDNLDQAINACNNDPDSDGWNIFAAEAGVPDYVYNEEWINFRSNDLLTELLKLPIEMQEVIIAWTDYNFYNRLTKPKDSIQEDSNEIEMSYPSFNGFEHPNFPNDPEDEIPF